MRPKKYNNKRGRLRCNYYLARDDVRLQQQQQQVAYFGTHCYAKSFLNVLGTTYVLPTSANVFQSVVAYLALSK